MSFEMILGMFEHATSAFSHGFSEQRVVLDKLVAPLKRGDITMCISSVQNAIKDMFGQTEHQQQAEPIEGHMVLEDFMSAGVTVDGVDYRLVGDRLEVTGQMDPVEVHATLEFFGISIPLGNISVSGSGNNQGPGPNP